MITDKNFISIQAFMVKELQLKGNELLVYALVYGFCQDGKSEFTGSLEYVTEWIGVTRTNASLILKRLVEKGLLEKTEHRIQNTNFKVCSYKTRYHSDNSISVTDITVSEIGKTRICNRDGAVSETDNNTIHNNIVKQNLNTIYRERFVPPTVEEVKAYCLERHNNIDAQYFCDYYESKGWMIGKNKMKDWKCSVRTWERNNFNTGRSATFVNNKRPALANQVTEEDINF